MPETLTLYTANRVPFLGQPYAIAAIYPSPISPSAYTFAETFVLWLDQPPDFPIPLKASRAIYQASTLQLSDLVGNPLVNLQEAAAFWASGIIQSQVLAVYKDHPDHRPYPSPLLQECATSALASHLAWQGNSQPIQETLRKALDYTQSETLTKLLSLLLRLRPLEFDVSP
jgi:hypothetical protein